MIHYLINSIDAAALDKSWFSFMRVFRFVEFRAVLAIILSFLIVITLGGRTIRWLVKQKVGDNPEFHHKDLNQLMKGKTNTPTMGGVLIAGAIFSTSLLLADLSSFYITLAMVCLVWLSIVGGIDDYLKLTTAQRKPGSREGLRSGEKLLAQLALAVVLGIFIHHYGSTKLEGYAHLNEMSHSLTLPFSKTWVFDAITQDWVPSENLIRLGTFSFVLLTICVIAGSSNAVNLTDGMDGLAGGVAAIVAFALMILAFVAGFNDGQGTILAQKLLVPHIPKSDELAIVAGAMVGACVGFLWFNCSPAQVFMGDTGSLPLGGLIGYIAVVVRQELLLVIIGGIFVAEAMSVILQVGYFKLTKGKRIFRCAPLHHHFHLGGWTEQQVVIRFWLITVMLSAVALLTIKLR